MILFFLCLTPFTLAGQTQEKLDSDLYYLIDSIILYHKDNIAQVRPLLEQGANPNGFYNKGIGENFLMGTIRHFSDNANEPQFQIAEMLLEYGADLYAGDIYGRTIAYYINSSAAVNYLVSKGIRFDITDNEGLSPFLYLLSKYNWNNYNSDFIFLILDWEEKNSPRFSANLKNYNDYLNALLSRFSKRSTSVYEDIESRAMNFMFRLLEAGADSSFLLNSDEGMKLIKWVIEWGKVQYVEKLLKFGVTPDAKDADGIPLIMSSDISYDNREEYGGITMLIEKGAPVNGIDKNGNTLLIRAADYGKTGLVKFLLSHGADPNIQNKKGETALMKSNHPDTEELVNALLASGANPNLQDKEGKTALMHLAFFHPNFPLRDGVNPAIKDFYGRDALFYCRGADKSMIEYLVSKGCRIDEQDKGGYTPLSWAAYWSREDTVLALLDNGADPNIPDKEGRSALHTYLLKLKGELSKYTGGKSWGKMKPETVIPAFLAAGAMPAFKDNEGNSALSFVLYISKEFPDMRIFSDQMLKQTDTNEIKTAKASSNKKIAEDRKDTILYSDYFKPSMQFLGTSVLIGGLSIGMREGAYKGRDSENFMGPVNSVITMGTFGLFFGGLIGYSTGRDKGFGGLADLFLWGGLGLISGVIVGFLPPVQKAFKDNPMLYYSPSALLALPGTIFLLRIWL
jgi:ankyrin repeat protein